MSMIDDDILSYPENKIKFIDAAMLDNKQIYYVLFNYVRVLEWWFCGSNAPDM